MRIILPGDSRATGHAGHAADWQVRLRDPPNGGGPSVIAYRISLFSSRSERRESERRTGRLGNRNDEPAAPVANERHLPHASAGSRHRYASRANRSRRRAYPSIIDRLREELLRRVAEPAFAVQIETSHGHRLPIALQTIGETTSQNIRIL